MSSVRLMRFGNAGKLGVAITAAPRVHRYRMLAATLACALVVPVAAQAMDTPTNQQLAAQVAQLEQEVQQLKQLIQQQQAAPRSPVATTPVAASAQSPAKPVFTSAPGISVALHGWISATAFGQNRPFEFGNGQAALWPVPGSDGSLSGVDVRSTRLWFDMTGAKFGGNWIGGGRIEMDFAGGYNGSGPFSQQQLTPRLRQAYLDLINPETGTTVRIGQQWELMDLLIPDPASLTHIAYPLGLSTGLIGWRFPGAVVYQDLNQGTSGIQWQLAAGVFEGQWDGPGNDVDFLTGGNVGFRPQLEARLRAKGNDWVAFFATHYSEVDLRGVGGNAPTPVKPDLKSVAYEIGGQWKPGPWVLGGAAYTGNGLGQLSGSLGQFGDIGESGGYLQAGYSFTPHWTAYATYAAISLNKQDVIDWLGYGSSGLIRNRQDALSLQYAAGPYAFALELMHDKLHYTTDGVDRATVSGNQVSLSAFYEF